MHRYSFHVFWSDEDEAYIAIVPGFRGVSAHGETPEETLREIQVALAAVIEDYEEEGWPLPDPQGAPTAA
ncbi:MAG: type II toxin-antitoxin system HicB family antitoxin [Chloroflexota bacterium]|nr:type II toxin-antitoxin system HicB family antitoxin [Chloroflexota bacterium]